jgi:hypothetical protein
MKEIVITNWWEKDPDVQRIEPPRFQAVAYYRHSAHNRQENSIPLQQEQVREWAEKNGVDIIHEFADAGRSGLNAEGRPRSHHQKAGATNVASVPSVRPRKQLRRSSSGTTRRLCPLHNHNIRAGVRWAESASGTDHKRACESSPDPEDTLCGTVLRCASPARIQRSPEATPRSTRTSATAGSEPRPIRNLDMKSRCILQQEHHFMDDVSGSKKRRGGERSMAGRIENKEEQVQHDT